MTEGDYGSVWEHRHFRLFRSLHEKYGAVFSLYCFLRDGSWHLGEMTDRFAHEFHEAASWLRWGFHGYDNLTNYAQGVPTVDALEHYRSVVGAIGRFAGLAALDRVPRVHYFAGTLEIVRKWRDSDHGILGLLTADDTRDSVYYLDAEQREALLAGDIRDGVEDLLLVRSDLRLERVADLVNALEVLPKGHGYREDTPQVHAVFTHEEFLSQARVRNGFEVVCSWAESKGIGFGFPSEIHTVGGLPSAD